MVEIGKSTEQVAKKSNRGLYFMAAILAALAVTGGMFAFTATTSTVGLSLTARGEFATVTANTTAISGWDVFGNYKGKTDTGEIFEITPDANFNGDLSATIMFANPADLVEAYKNIVLQISLYEDDGAGAPSATKIGESGYLSLDKGAISLDITGAPTKPYHVVIDSGFYNTFHSWGSGKEDITLLCDVAQKGAM